jgi:ribosome-associated protein
MPKDVRAVPIRDDSIRLGQFLKLADLIDTGSDAKSVIADGLVTVNDQVELRRGRQLRAGDTVSIGPNAAQVSSA